MIDFEKLKAPFDPNRIEWRIGSVSRQGNKAMALAYITSRDVMDRLDEVCGPENWSVDYPHIGTTTICRIGIKVNGEWVYKSDGAGVTDVEAEKGQISDAMKRCAVQWGIARYLYDLPAPWVEIDEFKKILPSELERLRKFLPTNEPHLNVGLPGLSKTTAKFWERDDLSLIAPLDVIDKPKWFFDKFMAGVDKAPTRQTLAKFQMDNEQMIKALSNEIQNEIYETCKIRAEQFDNH